MSVALAGETATDATGTGVTVTVAVPVFPSLVARMVVVPGATPVTTPLDETVAIPALSLEKATGRPVSTAPFASVTMAVRVTLWPTTSCGVLGETITPLAGTAPTATLADADLPSDDAVIVAEPGARAMTSPVEETLAIDSLLDVQVIGRSRSGAPLPSTAVAVS